MKSLVDFFPFRAMSLSVGWLAHRRLPAALARPLVRSFARAYKIDPETATRSLDEYPSIGDFFTRDLDAKHRPIASGLVCPVDGRIRCHEKVTDATLLQVKGVRFSVADLLGDPIEAQKFERGCAWNFYLSPRDAHHIHSPVDGMLRRSGHIPGTLFPVNDWALNRIPGLFVRNERVVSYIDSDLGSFAVVMVGAANVGTISLAYSDVTSWRLRGRRTFVTHEPALRVERGQKLGTFHLGSSVLLLSSVDHTSRATPMVSGDSVRYGTSLLAPGN